MDPRFSIQEIDDAYETALFLHQVRSIFRCGSYILRDLGNRPSLFKNHSTAKVFYRDEHEYRKLHTTDGNQYVYIV